MEFTGISLQENDRDYEEKTPLAPPFVPVCILWIQNSSQQQQQKLLKTSF